MKRSRKSYVCFVFATVVLGLASRQSSFHLPTFFRLYVGDALWALMVFWILAFLFPTLSMYRKALFSLLFCFGIEGSQLYHASWIDSVRNTRIGGLVLGFGFLWSDLLAYSMGIMVGAAIEVLLWVRKT